MDVDFNQALRHLVGHIATGLSRRNPTVLIGPLFWEPQLDRPAEKSWYFIVVSAGTRKSRIDKFVIKGDDRELAERMRGAFALSLAAERPIVIHDFDDELAMAKMAEGIFPKERRIHQVRKDIEAERAL